MGPAKIRPPKWDSTSEYILKKGTTVMAVLCVDAKTWCLAGDTLTTFVAKANNIAELKVAKAPKETSISELKVAKANNRFVTMVAGDVDISDIIQLEVRAYLSRNEGKEFYGKYSNVYNKTRDRIIKKLKIMIHWHLGYSSDDSYISGSFVLVDRKAADCLLIEVTRQPWTKTFTLCGFIKSRVLLGTEKVEPLYNKICETDSLEVMKGKMLIAMELAAKEDPYTGDMLTLFTGGKNSRWECVYARDFMGLPEIKACFKDLDVEGGTDTIKEMTVEILQSVSIKLGRASIDDAIWPAEVGGITVFVQRDNTVSKHECFKALEEGIFGSISKYPIMKNSSYTVNIKEKVVRDEMEVSPAEIRVLITEKFQVSIITSVGTFKIDVDESTTVSHLKRKMKKKLKMLGKNSEALQLKLEGRILNNNNMMYDLGVYSRPNKADLLWDNRENAGVFIDRVQERQQEYTFTFG